MIDRIVHHAEVLTLKSNSYRLKDTKLTLPREKTENMAHYVTSNVALFSRAENGLLFREKSTLMAADSSVLMR